MVAGPWTAYAWPRAVDAQVIRVALYASSRFGGEAFLPLKYLPVLQMRGYPARLMTHARDRAALATVLVPCLDDLSLTEDTTLHRALRCIGTRFPKPVEEATFGTMLAPLDGLHQPRLIRKLAKNGRAGGIYRLPDRRHLAPSA